MPFKYDFTPLRSKEQFLDFLGVDEERFEKVLAFDPGVRSSTEIDDIRVIHIPAFFRHDIPKKNARRGSRVVWEPTFLTYAYKALARRLSIFFEQKVPGYPHPRTFGYVGGRNIKENARGHCGHKFLISIDLENFFPSIDIARVRTLLTSAGVTEAVADALSRFVTIGGSLPLGLPTSPTVANAICTPMDFELDVLAEKSRTTFSRYADDISFSGDYDLPSLEELKTCVQRHKFVVAESKTRVSKLGQAHYVTGLSVSDPSQPHVPTRKKRRLRQELYYAQKHGLDDHFHRLGINSPRLVQREVNRLDGLVKFIAYHEPRHSTRLKTAWNRILSDSGWTVSYEPKNPNRPPHCIFIDEAEYVRPDNLRVLAIAMAVSQHQDQVNIVTQSVLDHILADVWAAGDREKIEKRGLHYSEATEDMRLEYVERMRSLPFEGYVAMAKLPNRSAYEATYLRLLRAIIRRRLMAAEGQIALLYFERNDKVSQPLVREIVTDAHAVLTQANNRRPMQLGVGFVGKPNLGMSVPDFLLGVLGDYLTAAPVQDGKPMPRDALMFERIRDKYRLILDVDSSTEFSRRRPISSWLESPR